MIPRTGLWVLAAILHDWCCEIGIRTGAITARETDGLFRRVMRELDVPAVLRWFIWTGVRWGAAANRIRRPGWWKDFPLVLAWTIIALPVVAPASVAAIIGLVSYACLEWVATVIREICRVVKRDA